jgi:hypothetical protein
MSDMCSVPDKRLSGLSQSLTVPIAHHSKGEREEKCLPAVICPLETA